MVARRSAVDVLAKRSGNSGQSSSPPPTSSAHRLHGLSVGKLLDRCSRLRRSTSANADELANRLVLRSLARRIEAATLEAAELERELLGHVRTLAPALLNEPGIGPIVAAQLVVAWSHPGDQGLDRSTHRRGRAARPPTTQTLPRPSLLPATAKPGAADDLTGHRSIIRITGPVQALPVRGVLHFAGRLELRRLVGRS